MRRRLIWSLLLGLFTSLSIAWVVAYRTTSWTGADASLQTIVRPEGTMSFFWLDRPCGQLLLARWQPSSIVDAHHRGGESKLLTTVFVFPEYFYRPRPYVADPAISAVPRWSGALGWMREGLESGRAVPAEERTLVFEGYGWPFVSLFARYVPESDFAGWSASSGFRLLPLPKRAKTESPVVPLQPTLPLRPALLGLAGSTAVHGAIIFAAVTIVGGVRGFVRRLRGRCPQCGFDLRGGRSRCSECGWWSGGRIGAP